MPSLKLMGTRLKNEPFLQLLQKDVELSLIYKDSELFIDFFFGTTQILLELLF